MSIQQEQLKEYIKKNGGRITPSRMIILKEIYRRHDHFDAEDIYLELKKAGQNISRASIYRTIPLLLDSGLVRELKSVDKQKRYEHILGHKHHEHMICEKCGALIEFDDVMLEEDINKLCYAEEFKPVSHQIIITGICKQCNKDF